MKTDWLKDRYRLNLIQIISLSVLFVHSFFDGARDLNFPHVYLSFLDYINLTKWTSQQWAWHLCKWLSVVPLWIMIVWLSDLYKKWRVLVLAVGLSLFVWWLGAMFVRFN